MDGIKALEAKWEHLCFTEEEQVLIVLDEKTTKVDCNKKHKSLIGKVCVNRGIGKEVHHKTTGKIWRISKLTSFIEVKKNLFIVTFATEADKQKVMDVRP